MKVSRFSGLLQEIPETCREGIKHRSGALVPFLIYPVASADVGKWLCGMQLNARRRGQTGGPFQALKARRGSETGPSGKVVFPCPNFLSAPPRSSPSFFSQACLAPLAQPSEKRKQECNTNRELPVLSPPLCLHTGTEFGGREETGGTACKKGKWKKNGTDHI